MKGVSALEFLSEKEIRVHFFHKAPVTFSNLDIGTKLENYLKEYRNNSFFHRRPGLYDKNVSWYDRDFSVIPTEIRPSLDNLIDMINLVEK